MTAGKFKATCLAEKDTLDAFRYHGIEIVGDIMKPISTDAEWEEFYQESAAQLGFQTRIGEGDSI
jgi:hypothetical protein